MRTIKRALLSSVKLMIAVYAFAQSPSADLLIQVHPASSHHMDTISNVALGSLIYSVDSLQLFHFDGTQWVLAGGGSAVISIDHSNDTLSLVLKDTVLKTALSAVEWADTDSIGTAVAGIYAKQAFTNGDMVVVTDDARLGLGVGSPTEKLDLDGNIRIRQVPTSASLDTVLLVDADGVVHKRHLSLFDSVKCFIQVTNTATPNINGAGMTTFNWLNTAAATHVSNQPAAFSVSTDGITINKSGFYKATIYQYQVGTTSFRNNAAIRFLIDGGLQGGVGANAYQRRATGHNESTASLSKIMQLTSGQKVGFINQRFAGTGTVTCPANGLIFMLEEL